MAVTFDPQLHSEFIPTVKEGFQPSHLSQPLEQTEIEVFVLIDGRTTINELAHLRDTDSKTLFDVIQSLQGKGVLNPAPHSQPTPSQHPSTASDSRIPSIPRGPKHVKRSIHPNAHLPSVDFEQTQHEVPSIQQTTQRRQTPPQGHPTHRRPTTQTRPERRHTPTSMTPPTMTFVRNQEPHDPSATVAEIPQIKRPAKPKTAPPIKRFIKSPQDTTNEEVSTISNSFIPAIDELPLDEILVADSSPSHPSTPILEVSFEDVAIEEIDIEDVAIEEIDIEEVLVEDVAIEDVAIEEIDFEDVAIEEIDIEEVLVEDPSPDKATQPAEQQANQDNLLTDDFLESILGESLEHVLITDETKHVAKVMQSFARVTSTFQLYDPRNDAVRRALINLHTNLISFLRQYKSLTLSVEPWTFVYQGEIVYKNEEREHSMAFKLFRDGIRELTFLQNISWPELARFIQILGMRYHGVHMNEDDIVTLFWKEQFTTIKSVAISGFDALSQGEEQTGHQVQETMETIFQEALKLPSASTSANVPPSVEKEEDTTPLLRTIKPAKIQFQALPDNIIERLHQEESTHFLPHRAARVLDALEREAKRKQSPLDAQPIKQFAKDFKEYLLTERRVNELWELLQRLQRWQREFSPEHLLVPLFDDMCHGFIDRKQMRRLLDAVAHMSRKGQIDTVIFDILRVIPGDSSKQLFELLFEESYQPIKRLIRVLLVQLNDKSPSPFIDKMAGAEPEQLLDLLHCLQLIQDNQSIAAILTQIAHPDKDIQQFVVECVDELVKKKQSNTILQDMITQLAVSQEADIRERAYHLIQASNDKRWAPLLIQELESSTEWSDTERENVIRLLAKLDQNAARQQYVTWAEPAGRFSLKLERPFQKSLRKASLIGLSLVGGPEAESTIKKVMQRYDELKQECVSAMRLIRRRQSGQLEDDPLHHPIWTKNEGTNGVSQPTTNTSDIPKIVTDQQTGEKVHLDDIQDDMLRAMQHAAGGDLDVSNALRKRGYELVMQLHMLIKNSRLYDQSNRIFAQPYNTLSALIRDLLAQFGELSLMAVEGQFYLNETRIRMERESAEIGLELFSDLEDIGVGGLTFLNQLTAKQLQLIITTIARVDAQQEELTLEQFQNKLSRASLDSAIKATGTLAYVIGKEEEKQEIGGVRTYLQAYMAANRAAEAMITDTSAARHPNPLLIRRASNEFVDALLNQSEDTSPLEVLALNADDIPMHNHAINTMLYTLLLGVSINLPREQLSDLAMASFLHDVGHLLPNKKSPVCTHAEKGFRFLTEQYGFQDAKLKRMLVMLEHHATPDQQEEARPALFSRIIRIADTYTTLISPLSPRSQKMAPVTALRLLWGGSRSHFDPYLVQAFINMLGAYPPGTLLQMSDRTCGVSLGTTNSKEAFDRPRVLLVRTNQGKPCDGPIVDLKKRRDLSVKSPMKENPKVQRQLKSILIKTMRNRATFEGHQHH